MLASVPTPALPADADESRGPHHTEILYRLTDAANRAESAADIFGPALDAICAGSLVERASILIRDDDGQMKFAAWRGLSDAYRSAVEGHSPWAADATDWSPVVVPDVFADAALEPFGPLFREEQIGALAFIPLVHVGQLLGKFMLYSREPRGFAKRELQFAETAASHVSQAVARSRLHARAEAANRAKDEFISLLGHELRNPLSPIVTALHLMRMENDTLFRRERRIIERQVSHMSRLVDDLLDVTRIARGLIELRRQPVRLDRMIRHAVDMVAPLLDERKQYLELVLAPDLVVDADEARLAQVVSNLVHNAAKFSPRGSRITVLADDARSEARIRVRDEGCGIDPVLLPSLFDMFTLGSNVDGEARSGLGLGLSIVRSLVELHGGRVVASSDGRGKGAEFTVFLPRVVSGPEKRLERVEPSGRTAAKRILVVDDNVDAADLLMDALVAAGHEVSCAYDGPSALLEAAQRPPDVALLDIGLPVMDGCELAGRMKALPGLHELLLVAVTGYGRDEDRARTAKAGFSAHIAKPVDLDQLLALITASERSVVS